MNHPLCRAPGVLQILLVIALHCAAGVSEELPHSVVLEGLHNPTGVAVQPGTGTIFVVESGAGQIVRLVSAEADADSEAGAEPEKSIRAEPVIVGFPEDMYGKGPTYKIGPLSIAFLDKSTLLVGGGGNPDGKEIVYVVTLPASGSEPVNIKDAAAFEPVTEVAADGDKPGIVGEGNFFNVVLIDAQVFATANGDDEKGWIVRGKLKEKSPEGALERFIATKPIAKVNAPVAITKTPQNHLLVGQMGPIAGEQDSVISFYDAKTGKSLMNLNTDLFDIVSLHYGPVKEPYKKSHLYALDFSWSDPAEGKLVRLDAKLDESGKQQVSTIKLASLVYPTSMAFGVGGELYVTLLSKDGSDDQPDGKLIKFEPGL